MLIPARVLDHYFATAYNAAKRIQQKNMDIRDFVAQGQTGGGGAKRDADLLIAPPVAKRVQLRNGTLDSFFNK